MKVEEEEEEEQNLGEEGAYRNEWSPIKVDLQDFDVEIVEEDKI